MLIEQNVNYMIKFRETLDTHSILKTTKDENNI